MLLDKNRNVTKIITTGSLITALSIIVFYLAPIFQTTTLALSALAGCVLFYTIIKFGKAPSILIYISVSIIGILIVPDKSVVISYIAFFGIYPFVKNIIESINRLYIEWILKLLFFNAILTVLLVLFKSLLYMGDIEVPIYIIYPLFNFAFIVYDIAFSNVIAFMVKRFGRLFK